MTDEAIVSQDASQIGVPFEHDAKKIESLALIPIDTWPHIHERIHEGKIVAGRKGADAQAPVMRDRQQMRHHGETA